MLSATTLELARLLLRKNITVVLNDIEIAAYLENEQNIDVILIGGSPEKRFSLHCGANSCQIVARTVRGQHLWRQMESV